MNREIKFRGKSSLKGFNPWVYGYLYVDDNEQAFIFSSVDDNVINQCPVFEETVGQLTGLQDKNGKDIYEGDILSYENEYGRKHIHRVYREKGGLVINSHSEDVNKEVINFYEATADMQTSKWIEQCEIIGNVFDNPELLNQ